MGNFLIDVLLVLWFLITGMYILFWIIGNSIRDRPLEWGEKSQYLAPAIFVIFGIVVVIIGLAAAILGDTLLITTGDLNPKVEHSIAAGFALYGAGIAVVLFGADLMINTRTEIKYKEDMTKMLKCIDRLIKQNTEIKKMLLEK